MWSPWNDFPREMGFPARNGIVYNIQEFLDKINKFNGKSTVFTSLYAFSLISENHINYESAKVKQLFFDFDNEGCLNCVRKFHNYLIEKDLMHCIFFSGGGFHVYVAVEYPNFLKNKKISVTNAQINLTDILGFKIGINEDSDVDAHIIGNVAQLVRVPNTFNLKRRVFCIPISSEDLKLSFEEIKEKAKTQNPKIYIYGKKFFDISPFDSEEIFKKEFDLTG